MVSQVERFAEIQTLYAQWYDRVETNAIAKIVHTAFQKTGGKKSYWTLDDVYKEAKRLLKDDGNYNQLLYKTKIEEYIADQIRLAMLGGSDKFFSIDGKHFDWENTAFSRDKFAYLSTYENEQYIIATAKKTDPFFQADEELINEAFIDMPTLSDEQQEAVIHVCTSNKVCTIFEGMAGAGKTHTSRCMVNIKRKQGFTTIGSALSWKATQGLKDSTGMDNCFAIASLISNYEKNPDSFLTNDTVLMIDEAGLVDTQSMKKIMDIVEHCATKNIRVQLVLMGDTEQLTPVGAGAIFTTLTKELGTKVLRNIRRQKEVSHQRMVKLASERRSGEALYIMQQQEMISWAKNQQNNMNIMVRDFLSYQLANPNKRPLLLAFSNRDVIEMNRMVRDAYKKLGKIKGTEIKIAITDKATIRNQPMSFAAGDEIVIREKFNEMPLYEVPKEKDRFDKSEYKILNNVSVFNRTSGKIAHIQPSPENDGSYDMFVDLRGDTAGRVVLNTKKIVKSGEGAPIHHNYAMTVYSSQGETVDHSFLMFDPQALHFRYFYVGISRHTDNLKFYINENEVHRLIDKSRGIATPDWNRKQGAEFEPLTELGRYTRLEMLNAVSRVCGRDQQNKTIMEYYRELNEITDEKKVDVNRLYKIQPPSDFDDYLDFDGSYFTVTARDEQDPIGFWQQLYVQQNTTAKFLIDEDKIRAVYQSAKDLDERFWQYRKEVLSLNNLPENYEIRDGDNIRYKPFIHKPYPILDMSAILSRNIEDYNEIDLTADSQVRSKNFQAPVNGYAPNSNRQRTPTYAHDEQDGLVTASGWKTMLELTKKNSNNTALLDSQGNTLSRTDFGTLASIMGVGAANIIGKMQEITDKIEQVQNTYKRPQEEKEILDVPFLPEYQGEFVYNPVKDKLELAQESAVINEEVLDWINEQKGKYWNVGANHMPRFLATNHQNVVVEKYDEQGTAKFNLMSGYPAVITNPQANENTPAYVVPGVAEWFYTYYYYTKLGRDSFTQDDMMLLSRIQQEDFDGITKEDLEKITEKFTKIPDVFWGAKDTDYGLVKAYLKGRTLKVMRGKSEKYEDWAIELQQKLWDNWFMKTEIVPPIQREGYDLPWKNATQEELRIADGHFEHTDLVREIAKVKNSRPRF